MFFLPGPSTLPRPFHNYAPPITVPDIVLVSSSSSSSDDECEVIGYVKPRHERTPEIIDLSNSETEEPASQTIELNEYVQIFLKSNISFNSYEFIFLLFTFTKRNNISDLLPFFVFFLIP